MPHSFDPGTLCTILECPELSSDACVCDESNTMIFLSVWGRDTAIQEFLARLTLKPGDDANIRTLNLSGPSTDLVSASIGSISLLEKRTARTFRRTLFGSMLHLWLLDRRFLYPDLANATGLVLLPEQAPDRVERLWSLVRQTCPLPLLDHWRDSTLALLYERGMLSRLPVALGRLEAYRLALDVPLLTLVLGELIRNDELVVTAANRHSPAPLRLVA